MRYLAVGGVNTAFGYTVSLALYYGLCQWLSLIVIAVIGNIICITFSFLTYKVFVFETKGHWLREYFRCYVVYGASSVIGIGLLWVLVEALAVPFWLAQAVLILGTVAFSYIGHSRFSFSRKRS